MSNKYKLGDLKRPHFVTLTMVEWADVVIRNEYKVILLDSLKYCQKEKGLEVNAYCIMTSHLNMILDTG